MSGPLGALQIRTTGDIYSSNGLVVAGGTATGAANAQTITTMTVPPIIQSTFVAGLTVSFIPVAQNTGAATLNVKTGMANATADFYNVPTKSTGPIAINKISSGALVALAGGELLANVPTSVTYNGTVWVWGSR